MPELDYIRGNLVGATFDDKALYATGGNNERSVSLVRLNNSKSGCYQIVAPGIKSSRGTLTLVYDGSDPPDIQEGTYGTLVIDAAGSECDTEDHPGGRVITVRVLVVTINDQWQVDGDYNWTLAYESSGAYSVVEPDPAGGGGGGGGV